jgi:hypothetical protein
MTGRILAFTLWASASRPAQGPPCRIKTLQGRVQIERAGTSIGHGSAIGAGKRPLGAFDNSIGISLRDETLSLPANSTLVIDTYSQPDHARQPGGNIPPGHAALCHRPDRSPNPHTIKVTTPTAVGIRGTVSSSRFPMRTTNLLVCAATPRCCTAAPRRRGARHLLPQGSTVVVHSKDKEVVLEHPYTVAKVGAKRIETETTDAAAVTQRYRQVMEALPARARSYTLNFEFGKTQLTKESRTLLDDILRAMQDLPAPEMIIIGHTDNVGSDATNDKLSSNGRIACSSSSKGIARATSAVGRRARPAGAHQKRRSGTAQPPRRNPRQISARRGASAG